MKGHSSIVYHEVYGLLSTPSKIEIIKTDFIGVKQNWLYHTLLNSRMPPFWTFCNGTGLLPWTKVNFSSFVQKINWRQKAISSGARESNKVMNKIACEAVVFMRKLAREGVKPKKWAAKKPGATRFLLFLLHSLSLLKLSVSEGAKNGRKRKGERL